MFVMGHIGCTFGIVMVIAILIPKLRARIDLRFILVGSLLPDIIDKPIGHIIFAESIGYGRLFGHTLLFLLILTAMGMFMHGTGRDNALCLSFATFLHLIEDRMWELPKILFYPLYGFDLPHYSGYGHWYDYFTTTLVRSYTPSFSYVFVSEMTGIGAVLILCIVFMSGSNILNRKP